MTKQEFYLAKIRVQKHWVFILTNYPNDEDLGLKKGQTREDAINEALDIINYYRELIQSLDNESR